MKIIFFCRSFDNMAGGVERASIGIMNAMVARGHQVVLVTWDHQDAKPYFELDPQIIWYKISVGDPNKKASLVQRLSRMFKVRAIVRTERPHVGIGFQHGAFLAAKLFTLGLGLPIICAERNSPSRMQYTSEGKRSGFIYQSMRLASAITIQIPEYAAYYPSYLQHKIRAIPNVVTPVTERARPDVPNIDGRYKLLLVGRLSYQKNQQQLIHAFAEIAAACPDWDVLIAGEGEDRGELERLISDLNLGTRVTLLGAVKDVASLYNSSHLFVLTSRWEGFPNALVEAMSFGLPVVGLDTCDGVKHLIRDRKNGRLAQSNDLSQILSELMYDGEARRMYGNQAMTDIERFSPQAVFNTWDHIFQQNGRR